ncbi:MAG: hypothetical protein JWN27_4069 [Candidatus Eremiobacteraeota bacterium]|jgi:hypothetical protein|nr:hypothetical protein [Candidatus Eremiobacteraeota bacterium]
MLKYVFGLAALGALGLGLAGCNGSNSSVPTVSPTGLATPLPTNPPTGAASYVQIELLSRPAVKEVFENFNDHKITNAVEPYVGSPADPLQAEIKATENTVRPPTGNANFGAALQSVLYPNVYVVDLSNTTDKASYLGVETGGATGGKFGGRDPGDDVIGISLGAAFGSTLVKLGVQPEDNQENACISAENVTQSPTQARTNTFPYLAGPH